MRVTPLSIWTSKLNDNDKIRRLLIQDAELTHPNSLVHSYIYLYSKAIHYLLNNHNESDRVVKAFDSIR